MGFFEDNFAEGSKRAPSSYHIQWEYKVVHNILLNSADSFNALGKDGWELCAYSDTTYTAMFKRPKYDYDE